ncbi:MAG: hypothetical protein IT215_01160, partial [Chitinophagaceae bacterium]|nr:hypothetical protein [Chitinophagaceae bacterium]
MKQLIKYTFLIGLTLVCINFANDKVGNYFKDQQKAVISNDTIKGDTHKVVATMYFPVSSQCDSDPLVTAGMFKINPKKASQHKWIAMSRDLIARWGGEFKYGDYVQIKGAGHKSGVYKVVDTMNKRFTNRIDFLETKGTKPYK